MQHFFKYKSLVSFFSFVFELDSNSEQRTNSTPQQIPHMERSTFRHNTLLCVSHRQSTALVQVRRSLHFQGRHSIFRQ